MKGKGMAGRKFRSSVSLSQLCTLIIYLCQVFNLMELPELIELL